MQNYIGKQIDRYRIIERLGMGGMAVVYKAYDVRLEREVALKLIRTEEIPASQHERLIKRFEREAKAQARFNHRHIVPVFDYGVVDSSPYLVMAYVEGGTLKDKIGGPVDYQQAVAWLLPIADALAYAHQRGIVHRDVKPSNILFDEAGQPLLTDFGIAKILETDEATLTGTGLGVGTPEYMAPEQWQGKAEPATDQYALGVVLYELLTGQKPYSAETPVAIALKQMNDPLPRPSAVVNGIPESVEKVLFKALAKDPADRYADMEAFGKALSGLKLTEQPTPAPERVETRKTTETPSVSDVQPKVNSEGPTVDELEAPRMSSDRSGAQRPVKKADKKKKKRGWLWIAGCGAIGLIGLIVLTLVFVIFWPQGGEKETPVAQVTDLPALVETEETTEPDPTNTITAVPDPTKTQTAASTRTSTTAPTVTDALGIGSTRVNDVDGAEMVYVPAGEFMMGISEGEIDWILDQTWCTDCERDWFEDEMPEHAVNLDAYWIYKHEVSIDQYRQCVYAGYCVGDLENDWSIGENIGHLSYYMANWISAATYCEWVGGRLPTEAEWEKAAQGEESGLFPWGENIPGCNQVNYDGPCFGGPLSSISDRDQNNIYGLQDMSGNVWEWVMDWYDEDYYESSPYRNPDGPDEGNYRVIRGGSYKSGLFTLRISNRSSNNPNCAYGGCQGVGFRCVIDP